MVPSARCSSEAQSAESMKGNQQYASIGTPRRAALSQCSSVYLNQVARSDGRPGCSSRPAREVHGHRPVVGGAQGAGGGEVGDVHAAGKTDRGAVATVTQHPLVQRATAGEDQVGLGEGLRMAQPHRLRGPTKGREVVHHVVDEEPRPEAARQRQGHRRVEPDHGRLGDRAVVGEQQVEVDVPLVAEGDPGTATGVEVRPGELRDDAGDGVRRQEAQPRCVDVRRTRLLDEPGTACTSAEARDDLLRSLPHAVPSQVRQDDEAEPVVGWGNFFYKHMCLS
jgi:hypothetical protein